MLNTSAWQELSLRVLDQIHLDPKNVRLEVADPQVEADIIEDLFANENVLDLVDGIAKVGYLTHEVPIVLKRRSKYYVVEGNRRVAALKAMQNPLLVPQFQARVKSASAGVTDLTSLALIRVKVAPSQAAADELIAAIHTSNLRKPWSPARQAAFFQTQIDNGRSYPELLRRYPTIKVYDFVLRSRVLDLFRHAVYSEPELADYVKTKAWQKTASTLERIYESKDFQDVTGMSMDPVTGDFAHRLTPGQVNAVAAVIVGGIRDGNLNTRSINTVQAPRFTQLIAELREVVRPAGGPDEQGTQATRGRGPAKGGAARTGRSGGPGPGAPGGAAAPRKPKQRWIALGGITVPEAYPLALRLHFEELSVLDVQKFPNAVFLVLRAVLEKSIKAYAEAQGEEIKSTQNDGKGFVQLQHCLNWFEARIDGSGPKSLKQPLQRLRAGKLASYTATGDALNAVNHNHHFSVDPDEALHLWNSLDPLLRELMKP